MDFLSFILFLFNFQQIKFIKINYYYFEIISKLILMRDWGLGIGDWGLGPIPNPQSTIPSYI
jgi:hypothetical protein